MWLQAGPVEAALASFGIGVVASLLPSIHGGIPRTVALLGTGSVGRRAATFGVFLLGLVALFGPLGLIVGVTGALMFYPAWSMAGSVCLVLTCATCAASMFGAFELALPARLRTKLAAVGSGGVRGAAALGCAVGLIGAAAALPFVLGLCTAIVRLHSPAWIGLVSLSSFALGLGASSFVAGVLALRLPTAGAWTRGVMWVSGVGFAHLAFTHVRDRESSVQDFVRDPSWWFGLVTGLLLCTGVVLAALHVRSGKRWMKLASFLPAIVGCPLFVSWAPHPHGNAPPITFVTDEALGRARGTLEHKPVLIVFNATWCCREVEHDMFPDPHVREEGKRYVAIAVDASDDENREVQRLQRKYNVVGVPTIILFDSEGREVSRINSMVGAPEKLAAEMKLAR